MAEVTELPWKAPEILDIRSSDESESNISPDEKTDDNEDEEQKQARLKRNKRKLGRKNRARQRKQAWEKYKVELIEYNKKKTKKVAEEEARKDRIKELTKELNSLKEMERENAAAPKEPERQEKELEAVPQPEPLRKSAFHLLRLEESSIIEQIARTTHREPAGARNRPAFTRQEPTRRFDREEGQVESEYQGNMTYYRRARSPFQGEEEKYNRFPCFAWRLRNIKLPHKFKPSNHSKYDEKVEPKQ